MDTSPPGPDRRDLLRHGLTRLAEIAASTAGAYLAGYEEAMPRPIVPKRKAVRPPGAVAEAEFRKRCTSCRQCAIACPYDALRQDAEELPWLWDPAGHPCYMCDGFPCIAACGTGALTFLDRRLRSIGLAEIDPERCVAHQGEACTACRDACRDARAITLQADLPVIAAERCNGCALCVGKCPAEGGAITVKPLG